MSHKKEEGDANEVTNVSNTVIVVALILRKFTEPGAPS